jgi:predicted transglutaminase-like cysteine proteinase
MRNAHLGRVSNRVRTSLTGLGTIVALALIATPPAAAQTQLAALPTKTEPLTLRGSARPTQAWVHFCKRYPAECAVDPSEPAAVDLTPKVWQAIVAVNRRVNGEIKAVTDKDHWGVEDRWDFPDDGCPDHGCGDCEDYQLLKRKLLAEAGLPRRAMRMTVVIDEDGQGHAVMMVRTTWGDFILDNKRNPVLPWHQTGYVYVKQEGQEANMAWASLGGATSPVVTANR